jgi:Zn-dependent M28 family amino/carboxypeptidase
LFAHWDSRPWADNDPDATKHYTPILGANDGASGVGVLLEVARLLQQQPTTIGIDIILLDAEDVGNHRDSGLSDENSWCLGSQYWARTPHVPNYNARFGILLDMVGGTNARFLYEYYSEQFARDINRKVWKAARSIGYDNYFVAQGGGGATDDHLFINQIARIPTIDIIPTSQQYTFFEHWHTVKDDMDVITVPTLKAVGQTILQVIYNEK